MSKNKNQLLNWSLFFFGLLSANSCQQPLDKATAKSVVQSHGESRVRVVVKTVSLWNQARQFHSQTKLHDESLLVFQGICRAETYGASS